MAFVDFEQVNVDYLTESEYVTFEKMKIARKDT